MKATELMINDLILGKALCAGGAYVVSVEYLKHVGTGVSHEGAHADNNKRCNRHDEMLRLVEELSPGGKLVKVTSDKTEEVEPAQLYGEDQLQQRSEEEGRQRDTRKSDDGNDVVGLAVLLGCGDNAQGNCNDNFKEE